jgi:cyanophycinase
MTRTYSLFGSGEFLPWAIDVDRAALERATAGDGSVVVLPLASAQEGEGVFGDWARRGLRHYEAMGVNVRVSALQDRSGTSDDDLIAQLEGASMYYFSGGNPAYLADTLRDTPFWQTIVEAVDSGAVLAGCSAGACFIGETAPDPTREDRSAKSWYVQGLRLLPGVSFGPHWDMLDTWQAGLTEFIASNIPSEQRLVAIDEDTAMIGDGTNWAVMGNGRVQVYAGGVRVGGPFERDAVFTL